MGAYGNTPYASIAPHDWVLLADMNNDGTVHVADLMVQLEDWLCIGNELPGDLNRDRIINLMDISLLMKDFLKNVSWKVQ